MDSTLGISFGSADQVEEGYMALLKFVWVAKASRRQALNLQVLDFVDLVGLRLRI